MCVLKRCIDVDALSWCCTMVGTTLFKRWVPVCYTTLIRRNSELFVKTLYQRQCASVCRIVIKELCFNVVLQVVASKLIGRCSNDVCLSYY